VYIQSIFQLLLRTPAGLGVTSPKSYLRLSKIHIHREYTKPGRLNFVRWRLIFSA